MRVVTQQASRETAKLTFTTGKQQRGKQGGRWEVSVFFTGLLGYETVYRDPTYNLYCFSLCATKCAKNNLCPAHALGEAPTTTSSLWLIFCVGK